ncbi:aldose 1-epimerase family protein [Persicobacter psychrovividus]|uniref:Aldose 1-epimerase family protein n=1 Tax=Persicobacter psychrovividus TaxID=387638 RepID=A0ABM7VIS6_9BACT|nr:hypothetical protein PEPS_31500 [Persicobacter psychrovividus]
MTTVIENDFLKAKIKHDGAELCSLINKTTGKELIWQADPKVWRRHAPILFPFVGRMKDDQYTHEGKTYKMGQHGFARDRQFDVKSASAEKVLFTLTADEESLKIYPFAFELRVQYALEEKKLVIGYQVVNTDQKEILFSIGAHPGFNVPLNEGEHFNDHSLCFEQEEQLDRHMLAENGLFDGRVDMGYLSGKRHLTLNFDKFDEDALVFEDYQSAHVDLVNLKEKTALLRFHFKNFPYLGIWTKPKAHANYICIEPWFGIADYTSGNEELADKAGIQRLPEGHSFGCQYAVEIP